MVIHEFWTNNFIKHTKLTSVIYIVCIDLLDLGRDRLEIFESGVTGICWDSLLYMHFSYSLCHTWSNTVGNWRYIGVTYIVDFMSVDYNTPDQRSSYTVTFWLFMRRLQISWSKSNIIRDHFSDSIFEDWFCFSGRFLKISDTPPRENVG